MLFRCSYIQSKKCVHMICSVVRHTRLLLFFKPWLCSIMLLFCCCFSWLWCDCFFFLLCGLFHAVLLPNTNCIIYVFYHLFAVCICTTTINELLHSSLSNEYFHAILVNKTDCAVNFFFIVYHLTSIGVLCSHYCAVVGHFL